MGRMAITRVLVTGSEGYIGSTLVPMLITLGYVVRGMDTCFYGTSGNGGYEFVKKDIRDIDDVDLKDIDAVIHLAALSNDPIGELDEELTEQINYISSVRLAKLAKQAGAKRFLFSSSCSIYGKTENGLVDEGSPVNPLTAYARSKIRTEQALKELTDDAFIVGLLRNSTVYGYSPNFRDDLVVNNFVTNALSTGEIRIKSDGSPWRPLIDVRDLSSVFVEFLRIPGVTFNGEIYNIGFTENNLQVKDILSLVQKALPQSKIIYTGEHGSDTRSYKVNFDKFHDQFPQVRQQWPVYRSIDDMIQKLRASGFSASGQHNKQYSRITTLKQLRDAGSVDAALHWARQGSL